MLALPRDLTQVLIALFSRLPTIFNLDKANLHISHIIFS